MDSRSCGSKAENTTTAAFSSPEGKALLADIPNFVSALNGVIVEESRYIWPENDGLAVG